MKSTVLFLIGLVFSTYLLAQNDCTPLAATAINVNRVRAFINSSGSLFRTPDLDAGFTVPYVPGLPEQNTIFAGSIWAGGIDPGGNLQLGALTYGDVGLGYTTGPLSSDGTGEPVPDGCENFDRIWRVSRGDILAVKSDFEDNGVIDDPIPSDILAWPGQDNPFSIATNGFELPAGFTLAPFFDRDADGVYNPEMGDYPVLNPDAPDAIPDEMLWNVFNMGFGLGPRLEVQLLTYGFNCGENELANNTVFTQFKLLYKGVENLTDFRLSFWFDPDLGCYTDDYLGIDTTRQSVFFYNADPIDGGNGCTCEGGVNTYCELPPVHTITFLNQEVASFMNYFNGAVNPGFPPGTTDPNTAVEYYNYMSGLWRDGTPLTVGGNGYNPGSNEITDFSFFSPPSDPDGWSMAAENLAPSDVRMVASLEASLLAPGQVWTVDMAHTFHQYEGFDNIEQVGQAMTNLADLQAFYNNNFIAPCIQIPLCVEDCVWPGDADNSGVVDIWDFLPIGVAAGEIADGPDRDPSSILWTGQDADNWTETTFLNTANYKHLDANGDGEINDLDANISTLNFGRIRPDGTQLPNEPTAFAEFDVIISHNQEEVDQNAGSTLQKLIRSTVNLGAAGNLAEDIYGIAFSILYDKTLLEPSGILPTLDPPSTTNNVLSGATSSSLITNYAVDTTAGRIDVSVCRLDGMNITGFGELLMFNLVLKEDALTQNLDGTAEIVYQVVDMLAVNAAGEILDLGARADTVAAVNIMIDPSVGSLDIQSIQGLKIQPNPTTGDVWVQRPANWQGPMEWALYDVRGRKLAAQSTETNGNLLEINLSTELSNGVYWLQLLNEDGNLATGKVILHR